MLAGIVLSGVLIGCSAASHTAPAPHEHLPSDSTALAAIYDAAIDEAAALNEKAVAPLTPVTPHNDTLRQYTDTTGTRWVQVVTWTDQPHLSDNARHATPGDTVRVESDVWTTLVPAVQQFCTSLPDEALERRLEQRLGLPPYVGYTHFFTFWVDAESLFRPCPNPSTSNPHCWPDGPQPHTRLHATEAHRSWLADQFAFAHEPGGYPFTGLGYTYDWGHPNDPVGFSEFVVPADTTIRLVAVEGTTSYCAGNP